MYRYRRIFVFLTLSLLSATALLGVLGSAKASQPSSYITNFPLNNTGAPHSLIQVGDKYWFTAPGTNAIGSLVVTSTVDYSFTYYDIPTANSTPYDLAAGDNTIWFTELDGNRLGKLETTSGTITEYEIPTTNSDPSGIDVMADGTVWFVQRAGNNIGKFDPVSETFTEYAYPSPGAGLEDITATTTGDKVWVTASDAHYLSSYTIATDEYYHFSTVAFGFPPYTPSQVAIDSTNNLWVSTRDGLIGRLNPSTVQLFRWFRVAPADSALDGLFWSMQDGNNQLWFTESNTGYAGQLLVTTAGNTLSKWRFPIAAGGLWGILEDDSDNVWIAHSEQHQIIKWEPPYLYRTYLPIALN